MRAGLGRVSFRGRALGRVMVMGTVMALVLVLGVGVGRLWARLLGVEVRVVVVVEVGMDMDMDMGMGTNGSPLLPRLRLRHQLWSRITRTRMRDGWQEEKC